MWRPAAGLLLGLLASCGVREAQVSPPNVVLLVMDTVRIDHLSCYGYERPTTPNVDALAQSAVRYTQCRASGPWTLPSHASMFTGRFAFQHRADSLLNEQGQWRELPLSLEHTTLAEALGELGYRTAGFVANTAYLRKEFQLDQGFEHYVVRGETGLQKNKTAFEWLDQVQQPFFLFLNYMDAHRPYNTQAMPDGRLAQAGDAERESSEKLLDQLTDAVLRDGKAAPETLVQDLTAAYDLGLANVDLAVGDVVAGLKRRKLWDNTLLIVTSDHGEYFGEHGLVEHSKDVYEEVLHVPLILKRPASVMGSVQHELISLADLPHLVAEDLPAPMAVELLQYFPLPLERGFTLAEISISREKDMRASYSARFRRQRQVLYKGDHKLILSSDGQHELYDLLQDPREAHNLYADDALTRELTSQLETFVRDHPADFAADQPPVFDAAAMRALEKLGYAGGGKK